MHEVLKLPLTEFLTLVPRVEILLLFTYANRPKVRTGGGSVSVRGPDRAHGGEIAPVREASARLLTGPQAEDAISAFFIERDAVGTCFVFIHGTFDIITVST